MNRIFYIVALAGFIVAVAAIVISPSQRQQLDMLSDLSELKVQFDVASRKVTAGSSSIQQKFQDTNKKIDQIQNLRVPRDAYSNADISLKKLIRESEGRRNEKLYFLRSDLQLLSSRINNVQQQIISLNDKTSRSLATMQDTVKKLPRSGLVQQGNKRRPLETPCLLIGSCGGWLSQTLYGQNI